MDEDLAPLPAGTPAPTFKLPRTLHEAFAPEDVAGRPLVLIFYPGDWEPVSRDQLARCQAYLHDLGRLGATLVGISVDSIWSHLAFARSHGLGFPLLADFEPKGGVARAYGVYRRAEGRSVRALFVIDGAGVIRWSRVYPTAVDPGVDGFLTVLEAMHGEP